MFWGSWKYERNGSPAKLTWRPKGVTYFSRDPLRSYFHEPQKNEIYFLNESRRSKIGSSKEIVGFPILVPTVLSQQMTTWLS